jgi:hypothetical protein
MRIAADPVQNLALFSFGRHLELSDHFGFHSLQQFFYFLWNLFFNNMQKFDHFEIPDEYESSYTHAPNFNGSLC